LGKHTGKQNLVAQLGLNQKLAGWEKGERVKTKAWKQGHASSGIEG